MHGSVARFCGYKQRSCAPPCCCHTHCYLIWHSVLMGSAVLLSSVIILSFAVLLSSVPLLCWLSNRTCVPSWLGKPSDNIGGRGRRRRGRKNRGRRGLLEVPGAFIGLHPTMRAILEASRYSFGSHTGLLLEHLGAIEAVSGASGFPSPVVLAVLEASSDSVSCHLDHRRKAFR